MENCGRLNIISESLDVGFIKFVFTTNTGKISAKSLSFHPRIHYGLCLCMRYEEKCAESRNHVIAKRKSQSDNM